MCKPIETGSADTARGGSMERTLCRSRDNAERMRIERRSSDPLFDRTEGVLHPNRDGEGRPVRI